MATREEILAKVTEMKNAYKRKWARENRDKVNAANKRWWEKKALQELEKEHNHETAENL